MYELTEEQLAQVVGGYTGYTGSATGLGQVSLGNGYGYMNSGAYSQTTPNYTYASGDNYGYASGNHPLVLGGATAGTTYTHW